MPPLAIRIEYTMHPFTRLMTERKKQKGYLFIPYIAYGDPDSKITFEIICKMVDGGAATEAAVRTEADRPDLGTKPSFPIPLVDAQLALHQVEGIFNLVFVHPRLPFGSTKMQQRDRKIVVVGDEGDFLARFGKPYVCVMLDCPFAVQRIGARGERKSGHRNR